MEKIHQDTVLRKFKEQLAKEFFEIDKNPELTADEKVKKIVTATSIICAAIAIQPIPFADIFLLTPIQAFMGHKIAQIRKVDLKEEGAFEVVKYLGGIVGAGFAAQQTAVGLYKIGLPGVGGFMTIPLVAGLTYGMGKAMDIYFTHKASGMTPSKEAILEAFNIGKSEGRKIDKNEVKKKASEFNAKD